jgi:hypothetical protein
MCICIQVSECIASNPASRPSSANLIARVHNLEVTNGNEDVWSLIQVMSVSVQSQAGHAIAQFDLVAFLASVHPKLVDFSDMLKVNICLSLSTSLYVVVYSTRACVASPHFIY